VRDIEKLLVVLNILGSLFLGFRQDLTLLAIPVAVFAVYVVLEDRALRSRIGPRAWPSEGFADFALGTNIAFSVWNIGLSAFLFWFGGSIASAAGI
jgi:hypothetical protein